MLTVSNGVGLRVALREVLPLNSLSYNAPGLHFTSCPFVTVCVAPAVENARRLLC